MLLSGCLALSGGIFPISSDETFALFYEKGIDLFS